MKKTNNSKQRATICLNMIVKDESHIIKGTLEMLCNKINFDYWVICDTGSTDDTPKIITDFFKQKKIKGELHNEKWVNFAHNRTSALEKAYKKTDLLLVFDADDELHGNFNVPQEVSFDEYHMKFGSAHGTSYTRVLLINNKKRFKYFSVIHEFISCQEPNSTSAVIDGDYYVVSGRSGSRNKDPDKYLKDALVLASAHAEALITKDPLYLRYAYYCANSYRDCGRFEDAIKWYKITLSQDNWAQEKYMASLSIYECYNSLNQKETGFFYLIKAFTYDLERVECLYPLLVHYCCDNMNKVAYGYYLNVKEFFETKYLTTSMTSKLFINQDKANFFVPYYMVLIADKVQDFPCVVKMYEIVFTKKQPMFETWYVKNFLYNLQFFVSHAKDKNFIKMANEYIRFLKSNGVPLYSFDFLKDYGKFGIEINDIFNIEVKRDPTKFSKDQCKACKNIMFYTGFSDIEWNYSYMSSNALGGSEKAVAYLSKNFPSDYHIYVTGAVKPETFDNISYVNLRDMPELLKNTPFHTIICSRYIAFLDMFKDVSFYQYYIWAHDTHLINYGCNLQDVEIVIKWSKYIDGCICQTKWHADEYISKYPQLKDKIHTINNGINTSVFSSTNVKQPNKFIYSSRTERGLVIVLALWPQILKKLPDAQLVISTYTKFPGNPEEVRVKSIIDQYPDSIKHLGQLNAEQLYKEMSSAEYWLYPSIYPETSCITALEMLMSEVICLYYPLAGLPYTMKEYGIQMNRGNEIEKLCSLTTEQKTEMRINGRKYAESCSWTSRGNEWSELLNLSNKLINTSNTSTKDDDKWWIYGENYFPEVLEEYKAGLKTKHNVEITDDFNLIINSKPTHVSFIYCINDQLYGLLLNLYPKCIVSLFNLEPLNLTQRKMNVIANYNKYNNLKIYDYSLSNIRILVEKNITNVEHMPYIVTQTETNKLRILNESTEKIYDFGILTGSGAPNNSIAELGPKRRAVVEYLLSNGFTVNIIKEWKDKRDIELAKCHIILNIHGQMNPSPGVWEDSRIFEHVRCDRLIAGGLRILSETCDYLDYNNYDVNKVKFIDFEQFKHIENVSNVIDISGSSASDSISTKVWESIKCSSKTDITPAKNYCFIHSCNLSNVGIYRLTYLIDKLNSSKCIDIFEKIFINNIGLPIENTYGDKFVVTNYSDNCHLYEAPTVNKMKHFSLENGTENANILYIHTKGVRYSKDDQKENDWIDLMMYFLVEKYQTCLDRLAQNFDAVGCNYYCVPSRNIPPHFSGNFWWARSSYLKNVADVDESLQDRNTSEYWLFRNNPVYHNLYSSNIDHYMQAYPRHLYEK